MHKFWNWIKDNETGERILRLSGPIDEDDFWGDTVTPKTFRDELESDEGDITVWVNSPGGSVVAASEIYTMLCDYKGKVTVKIDAIAASAASVVCMAGDLVQISPTGMYMIHDPMTIAMGNTEDMQKAITALNEVKESIINAYVRKTGLSRNKISKLMSDETWLNARKAVELGFADEILFTNKASDAGVYEESDDTENEEEIKAVWQPYSSKTMGRTILNRLVSAAEKESDSTTVMDDNGAEITETDSDTEPLKEEMIEISASDYDRTLELNVTVNIDTHSMSNETGSGDNITDADVPAAAEKNADTVETETDVSTGDTEIESDKALEDTTDEINTDTETSVNESDTDTSNNELDPDTTKDTPVDVKDDDIPIIGLDGKTKDGAMPYRLLRNQLDYLK